MTMSCPRTVHTVLLVVAASGVAASGYGCRKNHPPMIVAPLPPAAATPESRARPAGTVSNPEPAPRAGGGLVATEVGGSHRGAEPPLSSLQDAFFEYDRYDLEVDARASLDVDARILELHAVANVVLEGHCDERGSEKYNLALGDRRANTARQYLIERGVAPERLRAITYGEERPFSPGHDPDAWAKNRRAHLAVLP